MNLVTKARLPKFRVGQFEIVSQQPDIMSDRDRAEAVIRFLPQFLAIWCDIERVTGHRWKNTSYIRDSPSHSVGHSFDLAPDIADSARSNYAVYNGSDPVLYKREPLVKALQQLKNVQYSADGTNTIGIFIEPDHLHLQVLEPPVSKGYLNPVVKWQIPKDVYSDTRERMNMPVVR